jgi:hypothetical protein
LRKGKNKRKMGGNVWRGEARLDEMAKGDFSFLNEALFMI